MPTIPGSVASGSTRSPLPCDPRRRAQLPVIVERAHRQILLLDSADPVPDAHKPVAAPAPPRPRCRERDAVRDAGPRIRRYPHPHLGDDTRPLKKSATRRPTHNAPTCSRSHSTALACSTTGRQRSCGTRSTTTAPDVVVQDPFTGAERPARIALSTLISSDSANRDGP